ncbi:MAG: hypothetical protein RSB85_07000, partial [Rikenellaceae bacterium]
LFMPVVYSESYKDLAGKSGYFVMEFYFIDSANGIDGTYPAWVKASVSAEGAVTVDSFAINTGSGAFKAGQTK